MTTKVLLTILIFQVHGLFTQSKVKLRMDIVVAESYTYYAHEKGLKEAVLLIANTFDYGQNYTKMALLDYDYTVKHLISLADEYDKVLYTMKSTSVRAIEDRSYLHLALTEMLNVAKRKGRVNSLKVFLVITHQWPTKGEGKNYDFQEAIPSAKELNDTGLFFIIHDYSQKPDQKVIDYFKLLCGPENFMMLEGLENIEEEMRARIFTEIYVRACQRHERRCQFPDTNLMTCQSVWHFPEGYLSDEECRSRRNDSDPDTCSVKECHEHCDHYWPWQEETASCDCDIGLSRRMSNDSVPNFLANCPKTRPCQRCSLVETSDTSGDENSPYGDGPTKSFSLGVKSIGGICAGVLAGLLLTVCYLSCRFSKKSDKPSKPKRPPHYISLCRGGSTKTAAPTEHTDELSLPSNVSRGSVVR